MTTTMDSIEHRRAVIVSQLIHDVLKGAAEGHCVRVNYLTRDEAVPVCQALRSLDDSGRLGALVLGTSAAEEPSPFGITADRAIELRNRKRGILCLFVPPDIVDAAISSLGNSFAEIDGRELQRLALGVVQTALSASTQNAVRNVRDQLRGSGRASFSELLDFVLCAEQLENEDRVGELGNELWRVGLIADSRPDFERRLPDNREKVRELARPQRLSASYRDRIAALKVTRETARELEQFFAGRAMHDVHAWSRDLRARGLTFDRWSPIDVPASDLERITVRPFTDAQGVVLKTARLLQPAGVGGYLLAPCGEKSSITVGWTTEPQRPINVFGWRVAIEAAREEGETDIEPGDDLLDDLPSRVAKASARTANLKLAIDFSDEDRPEERYHVRVTALDEGGNELVDDSGHSVSSTSEEFFLGHEPPPEPGAVRRRLTVPTLALGRLEAAMEARGDVLTLTQPSWTKGHGITYFSARVSERDILNIALSPLLHDVERRTLLEPASGGRWAVDLDEIRPAQQADFRAVALVPDDPAWSDFWRARAGFFERLRKAVPWDVVEAADWSPDLTNAAVRYAQAYSTLLEVLPLDQLANALSLDTVLVRMPGQNGPDEAAVVLPTHPLRTMWFAAHAALLHKWEERLLGLERRGRRRLVDRDLLRALQPTNMPAFVHTWSKATPFLFFQNLGVFHAVALPAGTPDPLRCYADAAFVLGLDVSLSGADAGRGERLARYVRDFRAAHPYADPLVIALVNPDRGELIADALDKQAASVFEDDGVAGESPAFEISVYSFEHDGAGLEGLARLRRQQEQEERHSRRGIDFLQPALSVASHAVDRIDAGDLRPAHLALVSDLSAPRIVTSDDAAEAGSSSLSLYGLVARFQGSFAAHGEAIGWQYRIVVPANAKTDPHPAGPRIGDTLAGLQRSMLLATGRLLTDSAGSIPTLEVMIEPRWARRLEQLHHATDWVVTLDRFFGIDYYDSPQEAGLEGMARKYLIDYSPEFVDGLGHRMIVTTASHDEVALILRRAMKDLGFGAVERSVAQLLHTLKTVSGRLALQAMSTSTQSAAAVSLAAVVAWLRAKHRLDQTVLVPIDPHAALFAAAGAALNQPGQQRCDLVLVTLRRGVFEAAFIEVKWRRGPLGDIADLAEGMRLQMEATAAVWEERFFSTDRVDGALQRNYLASILRFYCGRAQRYGLLSDDAAAAFSANLAQFERTGATFKPSFEGYVVSLEDAGRPPMVQSGLTITVLTARDFEHIIEAGDETSSASEPTNEGNDAVRTAPSSGTAAPTESPEMARTEGNSDTALHNEPPAPTPVAEPDVVLGDGPAGPIVWRPRVQGSPHLFITGIPGQGKSITTLRILVELTRLSVPTVVFDFHGQLSAADSEYVQQAHTRVFDAANGLPFSPFECSLNDLTDNWKATAMAVAEIFDHVCDLGPIQRDALYSCISDAFRSAGFEQPDATPAGFPSLEDVRLRIEQAERQGRARNLLARCRQLLEMDLFRPGSGADDTLVQAVRRGLILDLHRLPTETLQLAAGAFVLRKIYREMFKWGQAEHLRTVLVLDEAHRLARDITLPKIMKEGRKFGVAVVVASQGLGDFHTDIVNNVGTKVAFRANHLESRKIAGFFTPRPGTDLAAVLENLPVGTALVQTPEMQVAVRARMRLPDQVDDDHR